MKESDFQYGLKKDIRSRFPGCYVLKADANDIPGIPDLIVLFKNRWASLEVKKSKEAAKKSEHDQKNQKWHMDKMNDMSFSSYIYPENKEEVLNAMAQSFLYSC